MHQNLIDMAGEMRGSWLVLRYDGRGYWICRCKCGAQKAVSGKELRSGRSKQCVSCNRKNNPMKTHGGWGTRLFRIWSGMRDRCYNKKGAHFHKYGARGIRICRAWRNDFAAFRDWAEANGYADKLSIDRIKVNQGYSPKNCRWITLGAQARNRRSNIYYRHAGRRWLLPELAEEYGLNYHTLHSRIRDGWTLAKALKTPTRRK